MRWVFVARVLGSDTEGYRCIGGGAERMGEDASGEEGGDNDEGGKTHAGRV